MNITLQVGDAGIGYLLFLLYQSIHHIIAVRVLQSLSHLLISHCC